MRQVLLVIAALAAGLVAAVGVLALHPAIDPVTPPTQFDRAKIARGAELAAIGDCGVCHTAPDGRPYAGGRPVRTPFGAVQATNITPDPETGIGLWSLAAFTRAMREGIGRAGQNLYPVLPYPHFTRATDEDIGALYAFLMTREPVRQPRTPNTLPFPYNVRALLAGWNLFYLKPGAWRSDPAHDADWNRGAYLVEAIGHCGACHSPHNALGAEKSGHALAGGEADGWYAPPLQASGQPWTVDALAAYLATGFDAAHGAAAGPMMLVTDELAHVPRADVWAISSYITAGAPKGEPPRAPAKSGAGDAATAAVFAGACGGCHGADAPMSQAGAPPLSVSAAVNAPMPDSAVRIVLRGIPWREGKAAPYMPAFGSALTDTQVTALVAWLRATYSTLPPWTEIPAAVAKARAEDGRT